mmetsp:Transcript_15261/g.36121  ORF Transcript_15261/g.36121 Transcript_15261/m.36121 type:complete len:172 (-) Transcript_15261:554-1069(-)
MSLLSDSCRHRKYSCDARVYMRPESCSPRSWRRTARSEMIDTSHVMRCPGPNRLVNALCDVPLRHSVDEIESGEEKQGSGDFGTANMAPADDEVKTFDVSDVPTKKKVRFSDQVVYVEVESYKSELADLALLYRRRQDDPSWRNLERVFKNHEQIMEQVGDLLSCFKGITG